MTAAILIAVVAALPANAFALERYSLFWAKQSDGSALNSAYGNKARVYAYPKGSTSKVNSIYVAKWPNYESNVELGWYTEPDEDPTVLVFYVWNNQYAPNEGHFGQVPINDTTWYVVKNQSGNDDWSAYVDSVYLDTGIYFDNMGFNYGRPVMGEERTSTAIHGKASMHEPQYLFNRVSDHTWQYSSWPDGYTNVLDGSYWWRGNHLADQDWIYSDDHDH